jgi:hypothetical protein
MLRQHKKTLPGGRVGIVRLEAIAVPYRSWLGIIMAMVMARLGVMACIVSSQ